MAYSKLPTVAQDYAVGFQTVNQAQDNLLAVKDGLALEHSEAPAIGAGGTPTEFWGHHNMPAVCRAIVSVTFPRARFGGGANAILGTTHPPIVTRLRQDGVGSIFLYVSGLTTFFGVPTLHYYTSTAPGIVSCYSDTVASGATDIGITCSIAYLVSGSFVPTDIGFSVAIYGV